MQKNLVRAFCRCIKGEPFTVTYWDGESEVYGGNGRLEPRVNIIFREKMNIREMLQEPEVSFGEAFMDNKIDIEGDLGAIVRLIKGNEELFRKDSSRKGIMQSFMKCKQTKSYREQAEDVQYHYDLGNDFFKLWLDKTMSYSSAYFKSFDDSLEKAQLQKIDHVLKKMQLKEGETLLDIGCGWGWLIIRAAREHGVKALGITLSREQLEEASRRVREEGLEDMVEVRQADYRDLTVEGQKFDKITSVGMFEHVGRDYIPVYFSCLKKLLKPEGLSLLHTITRPIEAPPNPWLEKYIFPWGYIPSLREIVWVLPEHSLHLVDVESLRMHYARTTRIWAENFDRVSGEVEAEYGERFVRMWRLYLYGCSASFLCSGLNVYQLLFSKNLCNNLPLTRDYLYL